MLRTGLLLTTALTSLGLASAADAAVHTTAATGSHATTFVSPSQGIALTDGSSTTSTVTPGGVSGDLRGVRVRLKGLTHTNPDDLDIQLVSPSGQRVVLMSDAGGSADVADRDLLFTPDAPPVPDTELPPFGGYGPADHDGSGDAFGSCGAGAAKTDLAGLAHHGYTGQWKLCLVDDAAGGSGSLDSWELELRTTGISVPGNGDAGAASAYPSVATVHGHTQPITGVRVTLNEAEHAAASDVDLLLVPPAGPPVALMSDAGLGGALEGTVTFADSGAVLPADGGIGAGTYHPANYGPAFEFWPLPNDAPKPVASLAALNGQSANGEWKLLATDDEAGGKGAIASWSVEVTSGTPDPATPATTQTPSVPAPSVPRAEPNVLPLPPLKLAVGALKLGRTSARFTLSAAAPVTVKVERRAGKRFVRVTSRTVRGRQGANTVALKRKLRRGTYRLTVSAAGVKRTATARVK